MDKDPRQKRFEFNWGTGITIVLMLFSVATLGVVYFATTQDFPLVAENYYERAGNYQEHIDRVEQTDAMESTVDIELLQNEMIIQISFPSELTRAAVNGQVELYRPNDSSLDQLTRLSLDRDGIQHIPTAGLAAGRWLVKINWSTDDKKYFIQESIFL